MLSDRAIRSVCLEVVRLLREERERQELSRYALADRSGLSQQMIGYVERGLRSPSFETMFRISEALDADLGELVRRARERVRVRGK